MMHTPGPWGYEHFGSMDIYITSDDGDIAQLEPGMPDMKANAALIAAAPELLEACERAALLLGSVNHIDYDYEYTTCDVEGMLNAAIRKAKGHDK